MAVHVQALLMMNLNFIHFKGSYSAKYFYCSQMILMLQNSLNHQNFVRYYCYLSRQVPYLHRHNPLRGKKMLILQPLLSTLPRFLLHRIPLAAKWKYHLTQYFLNFSLNPHQTLLHLPLKFFH